MKKQIISKFKGLPKLKISWWVFGLSIVFIFVLYIFISMLMGPINSPIGLRKEEVVMYDVRRLIRVLILEIIIFIPSLILYIRAFKKGERSWILLIGALPTIIIGLILALGILQFIIGLFFQLFH
jgi:hypothetical protein